MTTDAHRYFERLLEPIFRCKECNGSGEMNYLKFVPLPVAYVAGTAPVEMSPVEISHEKCRACKGTGRV